MWQKVTSWQLGLPEGDVRSLHKESGILVSAGMFEAPCRP